MHQDEQSESISPSTVSVSSPHALKSYLWCSSVVKRGSLHMSASGTSYCLYFDFKVLGLVNQGSISNSFPKLRQFLPVGDLISWATIQLNILTSGLMLLTSLLRKPTGPESFLLLKEIPWRASSQPSSCGWPLESSTLTSHRWTSSGTPGQPSPHRDPRSLSHRSEQSRY